MPRLSFRPGAVRDEQPRHSVRIVYELFDDPRIGKNEFLVLAALLRFANWSSGETDVSLDTLTGRPAGKDRVARPASRLEDQRTVRAALKILVELGVVIVTPRRGMTPVYRVVVPPPTSSGVTPPHPVRGVEDPSHGVQGDSPHPMRGDSPHGMSPEQATENKRQRTSVAALAANPPDLLFLHHFESEAEDATGVKVVRVHGRDRKLARQVIARCPGAGYKDPLHEAETVATRYIIDGKEHGWPITLAGLLRQLDVVRQRIAKDSPTKPADGIKREHPMSRMDRVKREWIAAHPGETPWSEEQVVGWAKTARRWLIPA